MGNVLLYAAAGLGVVCLAHAQVADFAKVDELCDGREKLPACGSTPDGPDQPTIASVTISSSTGSAWTIQRYEAVRDEQLEWLSPTHKPIPGLSTANSNTSIHTAVFLITDPST